METPRYPISELQFGKFPDSDDLPCRGVNLKTEVCANAPFPQLTMSWIEEVEMATSMNDLMTSQTVEGKDSPDFEVPDANIASALRKIISNSNFRRRVSVEDQRAQKHDRFLRGRQIAHVIYDHFQATGAYDAAQGLSDLFHICLHEDDIQDFDTRWDQALLTTSEIPQENVLEGLYKMQLQGSAQLQTVLAMLAMYDQETDRDPVLPSHQRLATVVRRHIDQMIRTRNFKAPSGRIETGVLVKSLKGRGVSVERQVGECHQWKATGQCSKGDSCSFSH